MKEEKNNIILIGMPFSGKTTTGRLVAQKLKRKFIDLDVYIEENEKMKISEIFDRKGESYFRNLETVSLEKLSNVSNIVLSTGGGTVQNSQNLQILKSMGTVFYLEIDPESLYSRIKGDKTRPLLQKENPKLILQELYNNRRDNFEKADYKINALLETNQLADEVIEVYENIKR